MTESPSALGEQILSHTLFDYTQCQIYMHGYSSLTGQITHILYRRWAQGCGYSLVGEWLLSMCVRVEWAEGVFSCVRSPKKACRGRHQ